MKKQIIIILSLLLFVSCFKDRGSDILYKAKRLAVNADFSVERDTNFIYVSLADTKGLYEVSDAKVSFYLNDEFVENCKELTEEMAEEYSIADKYAELKELKQRLYIVQKHIKAKDKLHFEITANKSQYKAKSTIRVPDTPHMVFKNLDLVKNNLGLQRIDADLEFSQIEEEQYYLLSAFLGVEKTVREEKRTINDKVEAFGIKEANILFKPLYVKEPNLYGENPSFEIDNFLPTKRYYNFSINKNQIENNRANIKLSFSPFGVIRYNKDGEKELLYTLYR